MQAYHNSDITFVFSSNKIWHQWLTPLPIPSRL